MDGRHRRVIRSLALVGVIVSLVAAAGVLVAAPYLQNWGGFHQKKISSYQCVTWMAVVEQNRICFIKTVQTFTPMFANTPIIWRPVGYWGTGAFSTGTPPKNATGLAYVGFHPLPQSDPIDWGKETNRAYVSRTVAGAYERLEQSWFLIPTWLPLALAVAASATVVGFLLDKPKLAHRKRGFEPLLPVVRKSATESIANPPVRLPPRPGRLGIRPQARVEK
jgi:hypothetical protein